MKSSLIIPAAPVRFPTRVVRVGSVSLGGDQPILIQSMTVSDTCDTDSVVAEIRRLVEVGCPLVRVTAPSIKDAENLREIKRRLKNDGIEVPLVADIHFTPNAALLAAEIVEKVRINPGNYADRKRFKVFEVTDRDYEDGFEKIRERFVPLVHRLKDHGTALRIGTNHGSLSDRIMNRYGDTPEGMVESALEFARICRDENFHDIVFSMKSSIPKVMIAAYRLLVERMIGAGMDYPLHIGVTEAGNGLEGRVKSAIGIGALLRDGIGDTIRVSLTEDAEFEVGACRNILEALEFESGVPREHSPQQSATSFHPAPTTDRRTTPATSVGRWKVGGNHPIRVEATVTLNRRGRVSDESVLKQAGRELGAELISVHLEDPCGSSTPRDLEALRQQTGIVPLILEWPDANTPVPEALLRQVEGVSVPAPLLNMDESSSAAKPHLDEAQIIAFLTNVSPGGTAGAIPDAFPELTADTTTDPTSGTTPVVAPSAADKSMIVRWRIPFSMAADGTLRQPDLAPILRSHGKTAPGLLVSCLPGPRWISRMEMLARQLGEGRGLISLDVPAVGASAPLLAGTLLLQGIGDIVHLSEGIGTSGTTGPWPIGGVDWVEDPVQGGYQVLQACRIRLTRTEFIACPSCGRTQFDLQSTTAKIRARTEHLKGVKIAIMGCIVNGPGEMADADFGYVGSGPGRIDLYVGKERVQKNILEAEAEDRLVQLLRDHSAWIDPV